MSDLLFDAGSITPTENKMWHLELYGKHYGFYETRDDAIEKALNILAEKRGLEDDDGLLIVSGDSMSEAMEIVENLCDLSDSAEDGTELKKIEDDLNKLYGILDNMNSFMGG